MGREVRRVPANWEHPKNEHGRYKPLYDGSYEQRAADWREEEAKWKRGEFPDYASEDSRKMSYSEWGGRHPDESDYMPDWPEAERTHYQMYETTSEGTPISPVMETPEALARWLVDNNASAFGGQTASYEGWLWVCNGGYAPSAICDSRGMQSGVEAFRE